jgi:hypothetical protein
MDNRRNLEHYRLGIGQLGWRKTARARDLTMKARVVSTSTIDDSAVPDQIARLDWLSIARELDSHGCAVIGPLITPSQCLALRRLYDKEGIFRSQVVMSRHGFGSGEYQYFSYPLPRLLSLMRTALYPLLAEIANRWNEALDIAIRYPSDHEAFLKRCHDAGQTKPTPLLLKYKTGDYNCLHQDLYGEHVFPLQVAILLADPDTDFTGGEFILVEQRPRMQSRPEVVPLRLGQGVIFPVWHRPVWGARGPYRVSMRHGVSRLRSGERYTAGIIFHDAT